MSELREKLAHIIKGDVDEDEATLAKYSRDTSIFERRPKVVVFPKDADDVSAVVKYVGEAKKLGEDVSVTARSAGTDMTGGDLTDSVSLVFTKYMNHIEKIDNDTDPAANTGYGIAEPGVYYRNFERATLAKGGLLLPSYPASRELCAIGGVISNNSGGELTLRYGKTNDYVEELDVVLSDGSKATFRELSAAELAEKEKQQDLEGDIYRNVHALIDANAEMIENARPTVTKNSAGYALWNVVDRKRKTFDLSQLVCGSQGTLALVTKAKLALLKPPEHRAMMITFLSDITILPEIVRRVLKFDPESYESYDKYTFKLAVRFLPQLLGQMGVVKMIKLGFAFIPEMLLVFTGGVPQFVLMAEFAEHTHDEALQRAEEAAAALHDLHVRTTIAKSESQAAKYWTVRRESFNLLRKHMPGLSAAPFIDDFVVHPDDYPTFLPELDSLLSRYHLTFTVAGHIGDGNFHIFPFIDMSSASNRKIILELGPRVYELVTKYHGSITGEHNDGIVRTPYLPLMFGEKVCALFAEVKKIFDPLNILNPGKKVGGTIADMEKSMIRHS